MKYLLISAISILTVVLLFKQQSFSSKYTVVTDTQRQFEIYRDDKGIPHIFAHSEEDALFGKGYAEAQDRLWDLMMKKFLVEGRMSQLFGRQGLNSDLYARNFKFLEVGLMNKQLLDEATRKKAQAYCDGINYYAKNTKLLPFQFYLFWVDWQNWTIQDTIGLLTFTTFSLQYDYMYELARQRLLQTVGFELAYKIINFGSKTLFRQTTIMKEDQLKQLNLWKQYDNKQLQKILKYHWANKKTFLGSVHLPTFQYQGSGSNAWVIGGKHTQNNKPLLSNDPHLASLAPPAFYVCEMGIYDENGNIKIQTFGASMSGIPAISSGVNKIRAWGPTASYLDNKDLFYQKVRIKDNVFQYFHENQWKNFSSKQQTYKVRWQGQIKRKRYYNHRGPVLQDIFDQLYYKFSYPMPLNYRLNHTITLDSALYRPDPYSLSGLINLTFTQDSDLFMSSARSIRFPNMDTVYINSTGDFGYVSVGQYPIRQVYQMSGFIKDGTVSTYDMKGFLQNKPELHNPKRGYLAMCNNKFAPDQYIHRGSQSMISSGRSYRLDKIINQKIASGKKFTLQDMKAMQLDTKDEFLSEVFPLVLKKLQSLRFIWSNQKTQKLFNLLKEWDYFMQKDSIQTSIYHVWQRLLQNSFLLQSSLSQQQREAIINHLYFQNYQLRLFQKIYHNNLTNQEKIVCSNQQTQNFTQLHPCQASIAIAFKKLPQQLQRIFKTDNILQYKWGTIHLATFKSIPFSEIPLIGKIWQRQTPHEGNSRTLNLGILTHQTKGQNKYKSVASPVYRFMTDLNTTYWSLDIGNSGNIFSKYYDNFLGKNQYYTHRFENPNIKVPQSWSLEVKGV